jgi:5-methylcytosine-specific restriction endonuclease McrA
MRAIGWRRAICLDVEARVEVLEYYDEVVRTYRASFLLPAVIRIPSYLHFRHEIQIALTRRNLLIRDGFRCQYCGVKPTMRQLTIDHVMPRSRGGASSWKNLVTACAPCNRRKGDRTPSEASMALHVAPRRPKMLTVGKDGQFTREPPPEWRNYLPAA